MNCASVSTRSAGSLGTSKKRCAASPSGSANSDGRRALSLRIIQFLTGRSSRHSPTGSISTRRPTDFGAAAANSAATQRAEGMADERRRGELQLVEQLAVIDDQVEPAVERVHRLGIAAGGAGMLRRIDRIGFGKAGDERAIGARPQGPCR